MSGRRFRSGDVPVAELVGAMLVRDGRVLLGLRSDHKSFPGCWDIVGGHVEPGETPWIALCRELAEEIGVADIRGERIATVDVDGSPLHIHRISAWRQEPVLRNDEHVDLRWFDPGVAAGFPNLATPHYRGLFPSLALRC